MNRRIEYTTNGGIGGEIKIDGVDVSASISSITIWQRAGELPEIELDLTGIPTGAEIMEGQVKLDPSTVMTLKHLGWTPPAG